jgi:hypothetical protein
MKGALLGGTLSVRQTARRIAESSWARPDVMNALMPNSSLQTMRNRTGAASAPELIEGGAARGRTDGIADQASGRSAAVSGAASCAGLGLIALQPGVRVL